MDSEAFDRTISFKNDIYAREARIYEGLLEGYENYQQGKTRRRKTQMTLPAKPRAGHKANNVIQG